MQRWRFEQVPAYLCRIWCQLRSFVARDSARGAVSGGSARADDDGRVSLYESVSYRSRAQGRRRGVV